MFHKNTETNISLLNNMCEQLYYKLLHNRVSTELLIKNLFSIRL